ncbi:CPBP family intramembrane glutamic endopeptidase [Micromonospora fluostatini]|uniref:CPBP family intramembrane glutamic endopeptidase n=1 Tax=Micromonospora sp. JCM 30529 TaxID=3421643 RepID=UPI003D169ADB
MAAVLIGTQTAQLPVTLTTRHLPPEGLPVLGPYTGLVLSFAEIACILPTTLLAVHWGEKRRTGTLSSVTGRLRWQWLAVCLIIAAVCVALVFCAGSLTVLLTVLDPDTSTTSPPPSRTWIGLGPSLTTLAILLSLIVGQVAAEEYVTRGVILQTVGRLTRTPWPAITTQATIFTALHGFGGWGTLGVLTTGIALGWLTTHTGGLEAALAYHLTLNSTIAVIAVTIGATDPTTNATHAPWPLTIITAATATTYTLTTRLAAHTLGITPTPHTTNNPDTTTPTAPVVDRPTDNHHQASTTSSRG